MTTETIKGIAIFAAGVSMNFGNTDLASACLIYAGAYTFFAAVML